MNNKNKKKNVNMDLIFSVIDSNELCEIKAQTNKAADVPVSARA